MLSNVFTRIAARVVLVTYVTQLIGPVVNAVERGGDVDTLPAIDHFANHKSTQNRGVNFTPKPDLMGSKETHNKVKKSPSQNQEFSLTPLAEPSHSDWTKAKSIIESFSQSSSLVNLAFQQSQAFQYHLSLEALSARDENYVLNLSRKLKASEGAFESLHTAIITEGNLRFGTPEPIEAQDDALLTLFKGSSVYRYTKEENTVCFAWSVPGFGTLKIAKDGTVILDQDNTAPFLTSYDLILETSKDLLINSLKVDSLTLNSPRTIIQPLGFVSTDRLHTDHTLVNNTGGLHVRKQLTGAGRLINGGRVKLEDPENGPVVLGIAEVHNTKITPLYNPLIESSHLHITKDNKTFLNKEDAEFENTGTLIVDESSETSTSFINLGIMKSGEVKINRKATNKGFWQAQNMIVPEKPFTNTGHLKILDEMNITSFLSNDGKVDVSKALKLTNGENSGIIETLSLTVKNGKFHNKKDGKVDVRGNMEIQDSTVQNDGQMNTGKTKHGTGKFTQSKGKFTNTGDWNHTGDVDLKGTGLVNEKGNIIWRQGTLNASNSYFHNNSSYCTLDQMAGGDFFSFSNFGDLHLKDSTLTLNSLTNYHTVAIEGGHYLLKSLDNRSTFKNGTVCFQNQDCTFKVDNLKNGGKIEAGDGINQRITLGKGTNEGKLRGSNLVLDVQEALMNEGEVVLKDLVGPGKFTNKKQLAFTGIANVPSQLGIKTFENGDQSSSPAIVGGCYVTVTPENTLFATHVGSQMDVPNRLIIMPLPDSVPFGPESFINRGSMTGGHVDISRPNMVNFGAMEFSTFGMHGERFDNALNASLTVKEGFEWDVRVFQNDGKLETRGSYAQKQVATSSRKSQARPQLEKGPESLEDLKSLTLMVAENLIKENEELRNQIAQMSVHSYVMPYLYSPPRVQEESPQVSPRGKSRVEFHKAILADLRRKAMGTISDLEQENIALKQFLRQKEAQNKTKQRQIINKGSWNHTGDIYLPYNAQLINQGTMQWHQGKWDFAPFKVNLPEDFLQPHNKKRGLFSPTVFENHGNWLLDQMVISNPLNMTNHGLLRLEAGNLDFGHLINNKNAELEVHGGNYRFLSSFMNHNVMKLFNHDWIFTDEETTYPLLGSNVVIPIEKTNKVSVQLGKIECDKSYTHDVQALPESIIAKGNVAFTKRYQQKRTLANLSKVTTPGRVTFYCPTATVTQKYEFTFQHLELYVEGLFKVTREFLAPSLTLNVNGPLICGMSNGALGTIAGTDGPLNITAHSVDARYGQVYGEGPTGLKSTKGNILLGAPIVESISDSASTVADQAVKYFGVFTWNGKNGSCVSSGNTLDINAFNNLLIEYGQTYSAKQQTLTAGNLILNKAGKVRSADKIIFNALDYKNTREEIVKLKRIPSHLFPCHPSYPSNVYHHDFPGSDQAVTSALGNIEFNVNNLYNVSSTLLSGKKILFRGRELDTKKENRYHSIEQLFTNYSYIRYAKKHYWVQEGDIPAGGSPWRSNFSYPCTVLGGKSIEFNLGGFKITGTMNAPFILIQAKCDGLFDNPSRIRQTQEITDIALSNFTQYVESEAQHGGILRLTNDREVRLPFGRPEISQIGKDALMLSNAENQHLYKMSLNPSQCFNALRYLPSGMYNVLAQSAFSELAHRVFDSDMVTVEDLFDNGVKFGRQIQKSVVTIDDLRNASTSMLLYFLKQVGNAVHRLTYLVAVPKDRNLLQGASADVIDVKTGGNLTIKDMQMRARDYLNLYSHEMLKIQSTATTHYHANGTRESVDSPAVVECTNGNGKAIGRTGFQMTGATLRAYLDLIAGSTEGNTVIENIQLRRTENRKEEKKGGMFKGDTTTNISQETVTSQSAEMEATTGNMTVMCGDSHKTSITGSYLKALEAMIIIGKELETHAGKGVNSTKTESQTEGKFSSSRTTSSQQTASFFPTTIHANTIHTNTDSASYHGTDFIADILYDNTKKGAYFGFTLATLESFYQTITESPLAHSDVGCKGGQEVMQPCRLMINQLVREINEGQMELDSVIWDKNKTKIIGKFAETTYQLKQWQTSWAHQEQLIPDEAMIVVALAVGLATQGMGVSALAPMLNGITAATGMQLSTMGIAMVNAGFSTLCSTVATSGIRGDLGTVLTSPGFVKSIGISMLSAGLCQHIGKALNIDVNPSFKEVLSKGVVKPVFTDFLQSQALKSSVNAGLNMGINGDSASEALTTAARDVALNSAAAWASYNIGDMGSQGKWTPDQQDLAHTGIGALFGAATHLDKPLEGAITGGLNAFAAARASRIMFGSREELKTQAEEELNQQGRPVTEETVGDMMNDLLHQKTALIMLLSASATAAITKDPSMVSTSIAVTTNVVENNCIPSMTKSLMAGEAMKYGEEEPTEFSWQDEFDDPRDVYYQQALQKAFPHEEQSKINAVVRCIRQFKEDYPQFAHVVDQSLEGIGTGLQYSSYATSALGGFAVGGPWGALLGLAAAKSIEAPLQQTIQSIIASGSQDTQELAREVLPALNLLRLKQGKLATVAPNRKLDALPLAANRNGKPSSTPSKTIEGLDLVGGGKKPSKEPSLTIRPGQEWKLKIKGTAQKTKTPGHALESTKQAIREAKDPEIGAVYLNNGYHKALREHGISTKLESNRLPDVLAVSKDGKTMRATEIQSKSDFENVLEGRNLKVGEQLEPHGIELKVKVKQIPSWDYEKGIPK